MGKKYFCEYCNRSFNENRTTRLKHENSFSHQKLKKEHYLCFREPEQILEDESKKIKCKQFFQRGYCAFDKSCTFSHYSEEDIHEIKLHVQAKQNKLQPNLDNVDIQNVLNQIWTNKKNTENEAVVQYSHELPRELFHWNNLPISMLPFNIQNYIDTDLNEWG